MEEASERTRNNRHRLQPEKYSLRLRKKKSCLEGYFVIGTGFRETVKSLFLEIFKIELDRVLDNTT